MPFDINMVYSVLHQKTQSLQIHFKCASACFIRKQVLILRVARRELDKNYLVAKQKSLVTKTATAPNVLGGSGFEFIFDQPDLTLKR